MNIWQTTKLTLVISLVSAFGTVNAMQLDLQLVYAIQQGSEDTVKELIAKKANVNAVTESACTTPLHYAASMYAHPGIVRALLAAGADPTATLKAGPYVGKTPLQLASAIFGDPQRLTEVKRAFLEHTTTQEVQSLMPMIAAFKKAEKPLTLESFRRIAALHLVAKKVQTAKKCLPGYPEYRLSKAIEDGVIVALKREEAAGRKAKCKANNSEAIDVDELIDKQVWDQIGWMLLHSDMREKGLKELTLEYGSREAALAKGYELLKHHAPNTKSISLE